MVTRPRLSRQPGSQAGAHTLMCMADLDSGPILPVASSTQSAMLLLHRHGWASCMEFQHENVITSRRSHHTTSNRPTCGPSLVSFGFEGGDHVPTSGAFKPMCPVLWHFKIALLAHSVTRCMWPGMTNPHSHPFHYVSNTQPYSIRNTSFRIPMT